MNRSFLDYKENLVLLKDQAANLSIEQVLSGNAPSSFLIRLNNIAKRYRHYAPACLGYVLAPILCDGVMLPSTGDFWMSIRHYCGSKFDEDLIIAHHLFDLLIYLFEPAQIGVWIEKGIASRRNNLLFDDGLLVGPIDKIEFHKEGVLTNLDWLLYDKQIPGSFVTGAFLADLLELLERLRNPPRYFGIAIDHDVAIRKSLYFISFTKAYIRGPIGLSVDELNSINFPSDPSGTITEHRRIENNPLQDLYPVDRVEVMWSRRDNVKTVQIEELLPEPSSTDLPIECKYVHARWLPDSSRIVHFDGGIKSYKLPNYQKRLCTDMKKYSLKADNYRKLFRIDADIKLNTWCSLTAKFFDPDELLLEYMDGTTQ